MSGYWQAIERVLRGEAADAGPRPRSRFEDGSDNPTLDPFDLAMETEVEAQPPAPPSGRRVPEARQDMSDRASEGRMREADLGRAAPGTEPRIAEAATLPEATDISPRATQAAEPTDMPATRQAQASPEQPPTTDTERLPPAPVIEAIAAPLDAVPTLPEPVEPRRDADAGTPVAASPVAEPTDRPEPILAQPVAPISVFDDEPDADGGAQPEPPAPSLTIEIGEIQIRIAPEGFAERVVPLRAAKRGRTASLEDFLAREAGSSR